MSFTGRFYGECDACGGQTKDTEVEYSLSNRIVHVLCPEEAPEPTAVCDLCFLAIPRGRGRCPDCFDDD